MFASSPSPKRELGYKVLPVEDALRRAIDWFLAHGYMDEPGQVVAVNA